MAAPYDWIAEGLQMGAAALRPRIRFPGDLTTSGLTPFGRPPTNYALTTPVANTADLSAAAAVRGGTVADWDTLKSRLSAGPLTLAQFYAQTGIGNGGAVMVVRGGQRYYNGSRQYYRQRFDSGPSSGFLVHDQVGTLYLGSWFGYSIPVLVER